MDWVKAYMSIWTELQAYIKQYHTTGLVWNKTVRSGFSSVYINDDADNFAINCYLVLLVNLREYY